MFFAGALGQFERKPSAPLAQRNDADPEG